MLAEVCNMQHACHNGDIKIEELIFIIISLALLKNA